MQKLYQASRLQDSPSPRNISNRYGHGHAEKQSHRVLLPCFERPRWNSSFATAICCPSETLSGADGALRLGFCGGRTFRLCRTRKLRPVAPCPRPGAFESRDRLRELAEQNYRTFSVVVRCANGQRRPGKSKSSIRAEDLEEGILRNRRCLQFARGHRWPVVQQRGVKKSAKYKLVRTCVLRSGASVVGTDVPIGFCDARALGASVRADLPDYG